MTKKPTPPPKARAKISSPAARSKKPAKVALVATKTPLRHFRLVSHAHSGKVIHHQHTSHVALVLLLAFVGVMLVLSHQMSSALTSSGSVTVGAIVNGPPPTIGAEITSPLDGAVIQDQSAVDVSGTCAPSTFVVVYANSTLIGSTNCTVAGIFSLTVNLSLGENILTALNFDNVNQPGPVTPAVRVTLTQTQPQPEENPDVVLPQLPEIELPQNPSLIPGLPDLGWWCDFGSESDQQGGAANKIARACEAPKDCESYTPSQNITAGGPLQVAVVCVPRILQKDTFYTLGLVVRGGLPPYALKVDWGNDQDDVLLSIKEPGYKTVAFRYANVGPFNVRVNATDNEGDTAVVETAVQVSGSGQTLIATIVEAVAPENWFTSPVPLYIVAVVTTLAFWGGDIFNRRLGGGGGPRTPHGRKRAA